MSEEPKELLNPTSMLRKEIIELLKTDVSLQHQIGQMAKNISNLIERIERLEAKQQSSNP